MEWISSSNLRSFVSRPDHSLNFLYNYDPFPATGMEMVNRHFPAAEMMAPPYVMAPTPAVPSLMQDKNMEYGNQEKKKRLTNDQLDSLENSFQEEIKLDPDRKMKLAKKLGLQPRQVAVWFQNRRARWKAKQLESLYDSLKQAFDAVSREKHKLQQEVSKLKAILMEQTTRNQVSTGHIDISGEETVESTSAGLHNSSNHPHDTSIAMTPQNNVETDQCHYIFNVDEYDAVSPYWGALPPYS